MSYKEEIIVLLTKGEHTLQKDVVDIFEKALSHTKQTGQSLESIVYEILEGIEEGKKSEESLIESTDSIAHILLQHAEDEMDYSYKKYLMAEKAYQENIARQYAFVHELLETVTHYASDHDHKQLLKRCSDQRSSLMQHMNEIREKISYNHELKDKDHHD